MKPKVEFKNRSWMQFNKLLTLQALVLLAAAPIQTRSAPGDLDLSFDPGSDMNGDVTAVASQSDGKVLIGGYFTTVQGAYRGRVARLNADGSTDHSFLEGLAGTDNEVDCLAVMPDGKILIGGYFSTVNGVARSKLARLNADGSLDSAFMAGLRSDSPYDSAVVNAIALQSDGRILIGGKFIIGSGVVRTNIARLNADGSLDPSFNCSSGGGYPGYNALIVQSDGKILIGGWFTQVNGSPRSAIARLNQDGSLDASFRPVLVSPSSPEVDSIALQPDGQIIVSGAFSTVNGVARKNIARLNADGSVDASFLNGMSGADSTVMRLALQTDGRILIGGSFNSVNGVARSDMARLNTDGSVDTLFSYARPGPVLSVGAVVLQTDGRALVGFFGGPGGAAPTYIFRLNMDGSQDPTFANGPGGPSDAVLALAIQSDGKTIIGGQFSSISGVARNCLARLNTDGSLDNSFMNGLSGPDMYVNGLALRTDGKVLIKGLFTSVNGGARTGLALVNPDGTLDNSFAPNLTAPYSLTIASLCLQSDNKVLIGGNFTAVNGLPRANLARLNPDGSLDNSFVGGLVSPNGSIISTMVQADGRILVAGYFTSINGVTRNNLARLNEDGSLDTTFLAGAAGPNDYVQVLAVQADGKILIAGNFTSVNGLARTNFTRLNPDGSVDTSFATYAAHDYDEVFKALVVQPDGRILVSRRHHLSFTALFNRLNPDGSPDGSFVTDLRVGEGYPTVPSAIALQTDGKILVGGPFTVVNQTARGYVARLMGNYAPLAILNHPQSQTAEAGSTIHLVVRAIGYPQPYCFWFANGTNLISCSTNFSLELANSDFSQIGTYTVIVSNIFGSVTSAPAMLNVIPVVERRPVPGVKVTGEAGSLLNVDYANSLSPSPNWTTLGSVSLTSTSQFCPDLTMPLPPERFYRAWQTGTPSVVPSLNLDFVPAITLTGNVGDSLRLDYINAIGPTDAWVTLATVTLTNTSQLYFDVSAPGQSARLYRIVPAP